MIINKTGIASATSSGGTGPTVEQVITPDQFDSSSDGSKTLTISAAEHNLETVKGVNVMMKNEEGEYVLGGTWGSLAIGITMDDNNNITITAPGDKGFDGKIVIF